MVICITNKFHPGPWEARNNDLEEETDPFLNSNPDVGGLTKGEGAKKPVAAVKPRHKACPVGRVLLSDGTLVMLANLLLLLLLVLPGAGNSLLPSLSLSLCLSFFLSLCWDAFVSVSPFGTELDFCHVRGWI